MLTCALQQVMDASASDILDFLERNGGTTRIYQQESGTAKGTEDELSIKLERKNHTISIYATPSCPSASGGWHDEIIKFEVKQYTTSISRINAFYDDMNPLFHVMFYQLWTRLAIAFGAPFAGEALTKLRELKLFASFGPSVSGCK